MPASGIGKITKGLYICRPACKRVTAYINAQVVKLVDTLL
jgi:hypothetical protein